MLQLNPFISCLRLLASAALFWFVPHVAAIEWGPIGGPDNYNPARHNPFEQDPEYIAPTLDLSGVGQFYLAPATNYFWVTMISDTYFLTGSHIARDFYDDYDVHFYHDNDPTPAESIAIDDTYHYAFDDTFHGEFPPDLWIGRLASAPSSSVKRYPLIKRPEGTNYAGIDAIDLELYLVGARGGEWGEAQSRVGLNDISHHYEAHLYFDYDFAERGVDEARTLCCDSSAPSFVTNSYANFALAGIHQNTTDINISYLAPEIAAEVESASGGAEKVTIVTDLAGDLNTDFKVALDDFETLLGNLGKGPGMQHADGDINGDGYVNFFDFAAIRRNFNKTELAPADFNEDFAVNKTDMLVIGNHWHSLVTAHTDGDANGDGYVNGEDFDLLNASYAYAPWIAPHVTSPGIGDLTEDGLVDSDDSDILFSCLSSSCSPQEFQRADFNNDGSVNNTDLQIMFMHWDPFGRADVNNDLAIDNDDISVLFTNWGATTANGKADGDLNLDGVVNVDDYVVMVDWWGRRVIDFAAQPALGPIPEPSTALLSLLCGAAACTLRSSRRRGLTRSRPLPADYH
jgi:hypothetical protein